MASAIPIVEHVRTRLAGVDFHDSVIDGVRVGAREIVGAVVNREQAIALARALGLAVR